MCGRDDDPSMHDIPSPKEFWENENGWTFSVDYSGDFEEVLRLANEYQPAYMNHSEWMRKVDAEIWAQVVWEKAQGPAYSEAIRGANEMRRNAFDNLTERIPGIYGAGAIGHPNNFTWLSERDYGCPAWMNEE